MGRWGRRPQTPPYLEFLYLDKNEVYNKFNVAKRLRVPLFARSRCLQCDRQYSR